MNYKRYIYGRGHWTGMLNPNGWASFYHEADRTVYNVSMAAVAASQEAAEDYVRRKTESLARGEPSNKYLEIKQV